MISNLRFLGDWSLWSAVLVGLALAFAAWKLYRRESRKRVDALAWVLPLLRSAAIFWLFLILSGPVLHNKEIEGELARVMMFTDASESMKLPDDQMEPGRKLLLVRQLGWTGGGNLDPALGKAVSALDEGLTAARLVNPISNADEFRVATLDFFNGVDRAAKELDTLPPGVWDKSREQVEQMRTELVKPAAEFSRRDTVRVMQQSLTELAGLIAVGDEWRAKVQKAREEYLDRTAKAQAGTLKPLFDRLDKLSRWERLKLLLLEGEHSLLSELGSKHDLEFAMLEGRKADVIWRPAKESATDIGLVANTMENLSTNFSTSTDLGSGVQTLTQGASGSDRLAVVLISDGQHNSGPSPLTTARLLANRGIPMYVVGMGSSLRAPDLAITDVDAPKTVFQEASVKGHIELKDDMKPGEPFRLRISEGSSVLWEEQLTTDGTSQRTIPFDFSIKELVRRQLTGKSRDLRVGALPITLKVEATPVNGERDPDNNSMDIRFSAITERPKVLMIEGHPRWEFRYLRNLLDRDQFWEINTLLAGVGGEEKVWRRGDLSGQFPGDRETLFSYQLICFGDVSPGMFKPHELQWIQEYVENSGGGVIFIDGRQARLSSYVNTPLGKLLPVKWSGDPLLSTDIRFLFKASGGAADALSMEHDPMRNEVVWETFPTPHFVAPAEALPGAEVLLQAVLGPAVADAIVFRRDGAGRVLYIGFDESWRWRKDVGDLYHAKFWNQISKWIMEPAFPVQDQYVSLDSGGVTYEPGEQADVRVRLRDSQGKLVLQAKAEAVLLRDGKRIATLPLEADRNFGGIFRAQTQPLEAGDYEVKVEVDGLPPAEMKATTQFTVRAGGGGEMAKLHANEELLRQLAVESHGRYLREEEIGDLTRILKPLSNGHIVESETVLWQSYWWFLPAILLLTIEWALRKRAGML